MKSARRTLSCDLERWNGNIPRGGILEFIKMQNKNNLAILLDEKATVRKISRREAGKRLFAGMAAGAAAPWITSAHPIWRHFENAELWERAESAAAENKLTFLNEEQFASLVLAAETIVPGSTKAGVAQFVDLLLGLETSTNQKEFLGSLGQIETQSAKQFGKGIARLSETERNELFAAVSRPEGAQAADGAAYKAFLHVREWIAGSYYSSEIGMRELGWLPDRVFAEFPGCSHTDVGH
jgi:gluconate 2-dehydrogenase gamma chain